MDILLNLTQKVHTNFSTTFSYLLTFLGFHFLIKPSESGKSQLIRHSP
jgi:hypothetical protein